jgi:hypothetical protein
MARKASSKFWPCLRVVARMLARVAEAAARGRHTRGRHSTTTSGSLRARLTPICLRFGPSLRRRPAIRLAFWRRDGGTDEFSGVFTGRRNCASSSSSSRIFSSRRSMAAALRQLPLLATHQLQQLLAAQPGQRGVVQRARGLTAAPLTPRLRRPAAVRG